MGFSGQTGGGLSRKFGERTTLCRDKLRRSLRSALLQVPSALVPEAAKILLNPLHPDASELGIEHSYESPFDLRLKS